MIKRTTDYIEQHRIPGMGRPGDVNGAYQFGPLRVIASDGGAWDHVSVSRLDRTPTWDEMESIKRLFFVETEVAMQLHVRPCDHINRHANCLHLWRPQTSDEVALARLAWGDQWPAEFPTKSPGAIPQPPKCMV